MFAPWRAAMVVTAALAATPAHADTVADFYKGKQINLIVGYGPGGGYDTYARLLARHFGRFVPGNPNVIVQNMPGAGSLRAVNYLYNVAPKDGATIGTFARNMPLIGLLGGNSNVQFNPRRFTWLGSTSSFVQDAYILIVRKDAPVKSIDEARRADLPAPLKGPRATTCRSFCGIPSACTSSRSWAIPTAPRSFSRSNAARSTGGPSICRR